MDGPDREEGVLSVIKTHAISLILCIVGCHLTAGELFQNSGGMTVRDRVQLNDQPIPVDSSRKYQIVVSAGATGMHTLEENVRVRFMVQKGSASMVRIEFLDKAGNRITDSSIGVLSRKVREYGRVFYPPFKADSMNLFLEPAKGQEMLLEKISVTDDLQGREKAAVNPHPTFEFGDLTNYGYQPGYGGGFFERPDGHTVFNTGFTGQSPFFPVRPDSYYDIHARGLPHLGRKSSMLIQCFGEEDTKPVKSMRVGVSEAGVTTRILIPGGAVRANFLFYHVILEELSVIKAKN